MRETAAAERREGEAQPDPIHAGPRLVHARLAEQHADAIDAHADTAAREADTAASYAADADQRADPGSEPQPAAARRGGDDPDVG